MRGFCTVNSLTEQNLSKKIKFARKIVLVNKILIKSKMARNCNESDDDSNKDPSSIVVNMKTTLKPELIKELLHNSFQDNKTKLGNDTLTLVVEVAKCLVTETCLRASSHALGEHSDHSMEMVEKCLPALMLDFP